MSRSIRPASSTLAGSITANGPTTSAPGATVAAHAATSPGAVSASSTVGGRTDGSNMRMILCDQQCGCLARFSRNIRRISGERGGWDGTRKGKNRPTRTPKLRLRLRRDRNQRAQAKGDNVLRTQREAGSESRASCRRPPSARSSTRRYHHLAATRRTAGARTTDRHQETRRTREQPPDARTTTDAKRRRAEGLGELAPEAPPGSQHPAARPPARALGEWGNHSPRTWPPHPPPVSSVGAISSSGNHAGPTPYLSAGGGSTGTPLASLRVQPEDPHAPSARPRRGRRPLRASAHRYLADLNAAVPFGVPRPVGPSQPGPALHCSCTEQAPLLPDVTSFRPLDAA